jgi:hypothetical protein
VETHNTNAPVPFVVLFHQIESGNHFDLMIDAGDALATWRLDVPPEMAMERAVACERIADHRRAYLDYEGPVSGNRGHVSRHDRGLCRIDSTDDERWLIWFDGARLRGTMAMSRTSAEASHWSFSRVDT